MTGKEYVGTRLFNGFKECVTVGHSITKTWKQLKHPTGYESGYKCRFQCERQMTEGKEKDHLVIKVDVTERR